VSGAERDNTQATVTLERVERYIIEQRAHDIVLRMRQGRRALGVAFLSLAVLFVSVWFGPYGPLPALDRARLDSFFWLWSGFFSLVFVMGLLGALYQEDWIITGQDIVERTSLGPWHRTRRVPRARSLAIRVEIITGGDDGPIFPYRLHFLDAERKDSGLRIEFQLTRSVDRFLEALRRVLPLDIHDPRGDRHR
jgi:hypothetical protein